MIREKKEKIKDKGTSNNLFFWYCILCLYVSIWADNVHEHSYTPAVVGYFEQAHFFFSQISLNCLMIESK